MLTVIEWLPYLRVVKQDGAGYGCSGFEVWCDVVCVVGAVGLVDYSTFTLCGGFALYEFWHHGA